MSYKRTIDIMSFIPISVSMDGLVQEYGDADKISIALNAEEQTLTVDFGAEGIDEVNSKVYVKTFDEMVNSLSPGHSEGADDDVEH